MKDLKIFKTTTIVNAKKLAKFADVAMDVTVMKMVKGGDDIVIIEDNTLG